MNLSQEQKDHFWSNVSRKAPNECWLWLRGRDKGGYGQVNLNGMVVGTHRVSWVLAFGPIPNLFEGFLTEICHSCDNPPCVNPTHLFLGNQAINMIDSSIKGRQCYPQPWNRKEHSWMKLQVGENNPSSVTTKTQVKQIEQLLEEGDLIHREIAKMFGISRQTVDRICIGKHWFKLREVGEV